MTKGRAIHYTQAELDWIRRNSKRDRKEMHKSFCKRFWREDVTLSNLNALCKRKGWLTGRDGKFRKGQTSANKGKKMPYNPNSARTQFKKGGQPHNTKELGAERVSTDGYVEISIAETNPHTGFERRFVLKHRYLWELANGPVPDGHCLKCQDGNKQNTDPSNWVAIPRSLLPRLNGRWTKIKYDDAPAELKSMILATARLQYAASRAHSK